MKLLALASLGISALLLASCSGENPISQKITFKAKSFKRGVPICQSSDADVLKLTYEWDSLKLPKFLMGACTHFPQGKGIIEQNLNLLREGGFNSLRDECSWNSVETKKGKLAIPVNSKKYLKYAKDNGIEPLLVLDYANRNYLGGDFPQDEESRGAFANYSKYLTEDLKGVVRYFQVWNEWDGGCGMRNFRGNQTSKGYADLLKETYKRMKSADPDCMVVNNSICRGDDFYEEYLALGVLDNCDISSIHTYNYGRELKHGAEAWYKRMQGIGELNRKYNKGKDKPTFVTEMGFPNHTRNMGGVSTYDRTALEIAKIFLLARTFPWVKGVWWYDFQDDGYDQNYNENNFGIVRPDLSPKPAYYSARSVADIVKNGDFVKFIKTDNPNLWVLHFKHEGKDALAIWYSSITSEATVVLRNFDSKEKTLEFFEAGLPSSKRVVPSAGDNATFSFVARDNLVVIKGDLSNMDIVEVSPFASNVHNYSQMPAKALLYSTRENFTEFKDLSAKIYPGRDWKGFNSDNLAVKVASSYTKDNLKISVKIKDNENVPNEEDPTVGDSIHFGLLGKNSATPIDLVVYKDKNNKLKCNWNSKELSGVKVSEKTDGNTTEYTFEFAPSVLGVDVFKPYQIFSYGFFVTDIDKNEMDSNKSPSLSWGIGRIRVDVSNFNMLVLE